MGNSKVIGVVVCAELGELPRGVEHSAVKEVEEVLDIVPMVGHREIEFVEWVASYYMCQVGEVIRDGWGYMFSGAIEGLCCRVYKKRRKAKVLETPKGLEYKLPKEQITLLHHEDREVNIGGIVAEIRSCDKRGQVLVLCPTHADAKRVERELSRYFSVALCTNRSLPKRRAEVALSNGMNVGAEVIVGTRVALWLPFLSLQGVIITEEHSASYRSDREPYYSTRECALVLASMHGSRCLLLSSFPSVESYYNSRYGQWGYLYVRGTNGSLRSIVLERGKDLVSKYTKERIAEELEVGRRVVVLQNRRGIASYVECERCGYVPHCKNCSVSLTLHRTKLGCHYCGYYEPIELQCKECGAKMMNRGRGTQQIESQLAELFPTARIVRVDSDSLADHDSQSKGILSGRESNWDIVVGTTLLLGVPLWDRVGIVAVLNVDNMLWASNFRVEEDSYRSLGLFGQRCRELGAELIVQSSRLDHRVVVAVLAQDVSGFYDTEIVERQGASFPPHSRMVRIEFRGLALEPLAHLGGEVEGELRVVFGDRLSPIYQPMVERQRGEYIVELLLKVERGRSQARAKEIIASVLKRVEKRARQSKITIHIEVDPS